MNRRYRILALLLGLTTLTAHAGLYKWTDADGKVHFSDHEPSGGKAQTLNKPDVPKIGSKPADPIPRYQPYSDHELDERRRYCQNARNDVAEWKRRQPITYNQQTGTAEPMKNVSDDAPQHLREAQDRVRQYCRQN